MSGKFTKKRVRSSNNISNSKKKLKVEKQNKTKKRGRSGSKLSNRPEGKRIRRPTNRYSPVIIKPNKNTEKKKTKENNKIYKRITRKNDVLNIICIYWK